jgi:hypothetical protein
LSSLNLNWREKDLPERVRTKHVHRLHPYLGKFIPQLAEIFLRKFAPNRVCDPFVGSGTTLVEANTVGIESVGCDIAPFNCLLSKVKTDTYDIAALRREAYDILEEARRRLLPGLFSQQTAPAQQGNDYLTEWFSPKALRELLTYLELIPNYRCQDLLKIVLSRAARSARQTPHHQLDFPERPQTEPYYCHKHFRQCQPTDEAMKFLRRYSIDTVRRVEEFSKQRTSARVEVICGDARTGAFPPHDMVFTSPPYVGLIDYHEQHRYSYELLSLLPDPFKSVGWVGHDLRSNEPLEIGAASKGASNGAKRAYVNEIAAVFRNVRRSLAVGGVVVIVAGDRHELYPAIAHLAGFRQEAAVERHVNRRTGRRSGDFYEQVMVWRPNDQ